MPGVLDVKGGFFSGIQETFGRYNATKGIDAEVGEKEAAIDVSVILEYGVSAVKVLQQLQEVVKQSVNKITGLDVVEVNCKVVDVMTRKEFNLKNKKEEENKSGLK
ncbi:MAG: Asp23/Gls24 family envelope stress response protein [Finegoldia magna]|nr:Asp23/Gls24 family envelope stress response protein [Finegoldia magna]